MLKESFDEFNNGEPVKTDADRLKQHKQVDEFNTVFDKIDMRNLLGYLNQSDWIWSLNIGNIMQISPLTMQDIYTTSSIEYELSRELVLEKIWFLAVSYFWVSTELRFIVQMKEDPTVDPVVKRKESEFMHGKALEVSCSFLPSEWPLVNHILMSYQKHHAPSQQIINENEEYEDDLKVIRPLLGIESNKHQPIVRANRDSKFFIAPHDTTQVDYEYHYKNTMSKLYPKQQDPVVIKQSVKLVSKKVQTAACQISSQYQSASSSNNQSTFVCNKSKSDEDLESKLKEAPKKKLSEGRKKSGTSMIN